MISRLNRLRVQLKRTLCGDQVDQLLHWLDIRSLQKALSQLAETLLARIVERRLAGRIGSRQETGVGYLDGLAAQLGLGGRWGIGGFAGLNPEVSDDLFGSSNTKAGLFASYSTPRGPRRTLY